MAKKMQTLEIGLKYLELPRKARINSLVSFVFTTNPPEFNSLREGTNGGGWKDWKIKLLLLSIKSCTNICSTAVIRVLQSSSLHNKKRNSIPANRQLDTL